MKQLAAALVLVLALSIGGAGAVLAQGATPTPTPTPAQNSPVISFEVDGNAPLPWPLPSFPTFPPLTPSPTLYSATMMHSTGYPNAVSTATAQVGVFTSPIDAIATPVAELIGTGPTPEGSDLDTGIDPGTGNVSFVDWAGDVGANVGPAVGTGIEFVNGLIDLGAYSPIIAVVVGAQLVSMIIAAFLGLIVLIIKAATWLVNLLIRILTMVGEWVPG